MAAPKHQADASLKIDDYIASLPEWSRKICKRLREIVLKSDPKLIEDWKWGPNYYLYGMVCGFAGFQKHVSFVFFQGVLLKDKKKILQSNPGNVHNKHIKFTQASEINEDLLLSYLIEAIDNNKKGIKQISPPVKTVLVAPDIKKQFKAAGLLAYFEKLAYSHRKEYIQWIEDAKKVETRMSRIAKAIEKLAAKEMMHDKYKK